AVDEEKAGIRLAPFPSPLLSAPRRGTLLHALRQRRSERLVFVLEVDERALERLARAAPRREGLGRIAGRAKPQVDPARRARQRLGRGGAVLVRLDPCGSAGGERGE